VIILALQYQNVFNIIEQAKMCSHYWTSQNVLTFLNMPKCAQNQCMSQKCAQHQQMSQNVLNIIEQAKMCSKSVYEPKCAHHHCMSQNVLTLLNDFKW